MVGECFAYGRLYKDASIAIYRTTSTAPGRPPIGERDFQFVVGIYDDIPGSASCPVVGVDPFGDDEDPWPPPCRVVDPIAGTTRIYHRGEIRPVAAGDEPDRLEKAAVWDLPHIVSRFAEPLKVRRLNPPPSRVEPSSTDRDTESGTGAEEL